MNNQKPSTAQSNPVDGGDEICIGGDLFIPTADSLGDLIGYQKYMRSHPDAPKHPGLEVDLARLQAALKQLAAGKMPAFPIIRPFDPRLRWRTTEDEPWREWPPMPPAD